MTRTYACSNPAAWHPTLHRTEDHHNPPRSWTLNNGAGSQIITLCGLCHNELHALLNLYVHADGPPPWTVLRTFSPYVRKLAAAAWASRIEGRTPFTFANPLPQETPPMADAQHVPAADDLDLLPFAVEQTTDKTTIRLVVLLLGLLSLIATAGVLLLALQERAIPDSLIAIGSATIGALGALLAKTSS